MNNKTKQLIFRIALGLLTVLMLFSASMYFFNTEMIRGAFTSLGYPTYIIYPLAVAKILGLIAIWTNKSKMLTEWAYAGFLFDFILALAAHLSVADGGYALSAIAIALVFVVRFFDNRLSQ